MIIIKIIKTIFSDIIYIFKLYHQFEKRCRRINKLMAKYFYNALNKSFTCKMSSLFKEDCFEFFSPDGLNWYPKNEQTRLLFFSEVDYSIWDW